jgi:S-formylglutathione hydrolase FrmB
MRAGRSHRGIVRAGVLARAIAVIAVIVVIAVVAWPAPSVNPRGAEVRHVTITSRFVHARLPMTLVAPAGGGAGRPLLVFLHGRGGDENSELSDELFSALRSLGGQAPDIAFPDGGDHSYWHNRRGGEWGSYVLSEVLPTALRALHANPRRVGLGGISMGGFGAYDVALADPSRFCAVGGHSAALWVSAGATAPGAFDDAADFRRHDLIAWARTHQAPYGHARLWLDGGTSDPFHDADETFARALGIRLHVWPGGHDSDYWNAHWSDYLRFYAAALRRC